MLRSMLSAASAVRNHQVYMDVVANNIANVNTTAFKTGRATFHELLTQVISGGSAPQDGQGGVNPVQIGLGMMLGGVDNVFTQGAPQATGRTSDLAIQGNGFFVFDGNGQSLYSRDGSLDLGLDGTLVNPTTGLRILGWNADQNGVVDPAGPLTPINIPLNQGLIARASQTVWLNGNLDAATVDDPTTVGVSENQISSTVQVYDSLGELHTLTVTLTKANPALNEWSWQATMPNPANPATPIVVGQSATPLRFDALGQPQAGPGLTGTLNLSYTNGAQNQSVVLDFSGMTQLAEATDLGAPVQDGFAPGTLVGFTVSAGGEVIGNYSNGMRQQVAQLALATFVNPGGLIRTGSNMFQTSANSGAAAVGLAGTGSRGAIQAGYLEMANVDLAQQFTSMIMAERGFQANSRVISVSDQMLQDLVNLVR